jgi:hypothetical protein
MSAIQYFIQREQQELEAALKASDARVRRVHVDMANAYTSQIDEIKRHKRISRSPPAS